MGRDDRDEDHTPIPSMRSILWVGRVKSNVCPELLEGAFNKFGRVRKVETCFAGFAFVYFEGEDDSDRACEEMNKVNIQGVGEIRVSKATYRGYQDACSKRNQYWRARGSSDADIEKFTHDFSKRGRRSPSRRGRQDSGRDLSARRSPSVRRRLASRPRSRTKSKERSASGRRRSRSWSRASRRALRRPSRSRSRHSSRSPSGSQGSRQRRRQRSGSPSKSLPGAQRLSRQVAAKSRSRQGSPSKPRQRSHSATAAPERLSRQVAAKSRSRQGSPSKSRQRSHSATAAPESPRQQPRQGDVIQAAPVPAEAPAVAAVALPATGEENAAPVEPAPPPPPPPPPAREATGGKPQVPGGVSEGTGAEGSAGGDQGVRAEAIPGSEQAARQEAAAAAVKSMSRAARVVREGSPSGSGKCGGSAKHVSGDACAASNARAASQSERTEPQRPQQWRNERRKVTASGRAEKAGAPPAREQNASARTRPADADSLKQEAPGEKSQEVALVAEAGGQLSSADRAALVCFFDGASACDLLLEGSSVLRLPDFYVPYVLNGFPHGFQGLSQEDGMKLLDVLARSATARSDRGGEQGAERSMEVRQTLIVDRCGRRIMRKTLLISGEEVCSEEQTV